MTRDEVLEVLDSYADEFSELMKSTGETWRRDVYMGRASAFRAAAELIRAGGWRPIAEAPEDASGNTYGKWSFRRHAFAWEEFCGTSKEAAIDFGFTHYLLKPEPPAREVENG